MTTGSEHKVIYHINPKWLGRLFLDIFIPSLNIGIDYQGNSIKNL